MKIEVYVSKDMAKFGGKIDDKSFDFTVEEFINLIGAFQQTVANAQGKEIAEGDIITASKIQGQ